MHVLDGFLAVTNNRGNSPQLMLLGATLQGYCREIHAKLQGPSSEP